jgi:hypothetical protein
MTLRKSKFWSLLLVYAFFLAAIGIHPIPQAQATVYTVAVTPKFKAFEPGTGNPLASGKLYTYLPGTTTEVTTYKDYAGAASNVNPIILDANGECDLFYTGYLKLALYDAGNVLVWTKDNIPYGPFPRYFSTDAFSDNLTLYGKDVVGDNTGTVSGYLAVYDNQVVNITDPRWGAVAGGSASANATALAAAITYANANNLDLFIPKGVFAYDGAGLTFTTSTTTGHGSIYGVGPGSALDYQGTGVALSMADNTGSGRYAPYLHDFRITTSAGTPTGGLHIGTGTYYGSVNGDRVYVDGFDAVNAFGLKASKVVSSHFTDSSFWANYDGITTDNTLDSWPTTLTFSASRFWGNDRHGVNLRGGFGIIFDENCVFESNQHAGVYGRGGTSGDVPLRKIVIMDSHFEDNGLSGESDDYNIDVVGDNNASVIADIRWENNYLPDTLAGGHIRYGKIWYGVIRDNYASGTDGAVDVENTGGNRFIEWVRNHGMNETNVTAHGNNAEDADMYQAAGINLRLASNPEYWSVHQLKASSALISLPGDNATLTTIASLILNGTGADIAGGIVLVSGYNAGLTAYFVDLVALSYGAAAVISTSNTVGSPAARTYSVASNVNLQVKFANDADTYAVRVSQLTN